MKSFVRMTKISNVTGRSGYIKDPDRQEEVVALSDPMDWKPYVEFEKQNQKSSKKNNEARELIIMLPNSWYHLPKDELNRKAQRLAEASIGKLTDMEWAVHWNHGRTNLHMHIIFSERTREKSKKVWDRDIYLTSDGKVARKKSERRRDTEGNILPPVYLKGEEKESSFSAKNSDYKTKKWLLEAKFKVIHEMTSMGVKIAQNGFLHEFHEGKGSESAQIKEKNRLIRMTNEIFEPYRAEFTQEEELEWKFIAWNTVESGMIPYIAKADDGEIIGYKITPQGYENHKTALKAEPLIDRLEVSEKSLSRVQRERERLNFFQFTKKKSLNQQIEKLEKEVASLKTDLEALGLDTRIETRLLRVLIDSYKLKKPEKVEEKKEPLDSTINRTERSKEEKQMTMEEVKSNLEASRESTPTPSHRTREKTNSRDDR